LRGCRASKPQRPRAVAISSSFSPCTTSDRRAWETGARLPRSGIAAQQSAEIFFDGARRRFETSSLN
jgi:hypothetical protein